MLYFKVLSTVLWKNQKTDFLIKRIYAYTYTHIRVYFYAYYAHVLVIVYLSGTVAGFHVGPLSKLN